MPEGLATSEDIRSYRQLASHTVSTGTLVNYSILYTPQTPFLTVQMAYKSNFS